MMQEKRILISPQDILSIGYECPYCGSIYSVPMKKVDRITKLCANCQQLLVSDTQEASNILSETFVLGQLIDCLRQLQQRKFGGYIRFEIQGETKPEAKVREGA